MSLPQQLKNFALFVDGESYVGQITEVNLPKLSRKTEAYRAGGMNGPVDVALGMEGLELKWTAAGYIKSMLTQWGNTSTGGVLLRFAGALQAADSTGVTSLEVTVRGFHKEMDPGKAEAGGKTEIQVVSSLSYYKLELNKQPIIEIDFVNMIEIVNGVDLMAGIKEAIGL